MDLSLANVDLNENPYAGTEHDTNKSLRDLALEMIMARRENRSQLAQIARNMRWAVGPDGFNTELRRAVQDFIKFDVEFAGGRPSARVLFRKQGICSCMPRLPRPSRKPQMRPAKGGTRQPFRPESVRRQESSSTKTEN